MTGKPRPALSVVFAGGGTGGHLFPGVAVAREVVRRHADARVVFVGAGRGIESRALAREGFPLERVRSRGLMGKSLRAIGRAIALAPVTVIDALAVLRRTRPDVVVGLGGYSAGPVVLLAALGGRPTMLMEQNAVPGITNRLLAPVVRAAAVSYDAASAHFGAKAFVAGNPVRAAFFDSAIPRSDDRPRVLVLGGSQGAHTLNEALVGAAPALARGEPRLALTHQTGEGDLETVRAGYRPAGAHRAVAAGGARPSAAQRGGAGGGGSRGGGRGGGAAGGARAPAPGAAGRPGPAVRDVGCGSSPGASRRGAPRRRSDRAPGRDRPGGSGRRVSVESRCVKGSGGFTWSGSVASA